MLDLEEMAQQKLKIELPKNLNLTDYEVSILKIMGLGETWIMLCGPNTTYSQTLIKQAIATYDGAGMTPFIDGCTIKLTPEAIAEALQVFIEPENKGQTIEKEELIPVSRCLSLLSPPIVVCENL